jgi:dipeptidase E
MKLYLSSIGIPAPEDLAKLLGKPLAETTVALIPNAKDYYSKRAWDYKINSRIAYMERFGFKIEVVDLRNYSDQSVLSDKLSAYDLIWAMGGNTFTLRYEARRSGFDKIIQPLLDKGIVYGGDSAGALLVGLSLAGIESADEPEFAEEVIEDGIGLVPFHILPHVDNPEFRDVVPLFKQLHEGEEIIELKDSQAVIFENDAHQVITGQLPTDF